MPVGRTVYPEISIRMSRVLTLLARHHSQREIATLLSVPRSTVRDEIARAEHVTRCGDQRELARWWDEHRLPWVRWLLAQLDLDARDLTA